MGVDPVLMKLRAAFSFPSFSHVFDPSFRESFCESEEGVRLPRKTADLRGSPGNFRGSPGNFRGSLGNFRGTSGLLFSSTVRELPGKSPKTSGELPGKSGDFRGSSGEPDSLPV